MKKKKMIKAKYSNIRKEIYFLVLFYKITRNNLFKIQMKIIYLFKFYNYIINFSTNIYLFLTIIINNSQK